MELEDMSVREVIQLYSNSIKELKRRGVLRTSNVVGEIGEFYVLEKYNSEKALPTLSSLPVGTKNINAIDQNGERYSIKSTTGNTTSVFYGLEPPGSTHSDKQLFEYVVICKLDENFNLKGIYQLDWDGFLKHKKWHSRMRAWNLTLSGSLKRDSRIILESDPETEESAMEKEKKETVTISTKQKKKNAAVAEKRQNGHRTVSVMHENSLGDSKVKSTSGKKIMAVSWEQTPEINHEKVKTGAVERIAEYLGIELERESSSRYVTQDKRKALFVLSAKYSQKNKEYWYSINDENLPWMDLFDECYIAFAMGSEKHVLMFTYRDMKEIMKGCLRTEDDEAKGKSAHYHIAFALEGERHIYFKKKLPEHEYLDVTDALLENWK